ncbi:MAG: dynamin family protein, partial [Muribaculaceae bacterium]|nr:dynamin family protein [Muribaculaceae bacterium]
MKNSIDAIIKLKQILSSDNSFSEEIRELDRKKAMWELDMIRVGVIGVTSSGKSTMINALLGEQLLPAEAKPSSSQLVSCRTGNRREANIYFERKSTLTLQGSYLTPEIISKYGNENDNQSNKELVRQIEIISPNLKIPANVELVDSPGLDAYGLDGHEAITMENLLPTIDTCIFVTTCKSNSDLKMQTFLNAAASHRKPVISNYSGMPIPLGHDSSRGLLLTQVM